MAQRQYFYAWSDWKDSWSMSPAALRKMFKKHLADEFGHGYDVKPDHTPYQGHVAIRITGFNKAKTLALARAINEYSYIGDPTARDIEPIPYGYQY